MLSAATRPRASESQTHSVLKLSTASARMLLARSKGINSVSTPVVFILIRSLSEGEAYRGHPVVLVGMELRGGNLHASATSET